MSDLDVFGPSIDSSDVEAAVLAHLEHWMPTYVPRQARRKGYAHGAVEEIRTYTVRHLAAEKWPEDQIPLILAVSPGMVEDPVIAEDGQMEAMYGITLAAIAEGVDEEDSKALARLYSRAATEAILQHPDLADFAGATWMGRESLSPITKGLEAERNLMGVYVPFKIWVQGVMNVVAGPDEPLPDPDKEPASRNSVKKGGGSVQIEVGEDKVALLRDGGFFDDA